LSIVLGRDKLWCKTVGAGIARKRGVDANLRLSVKPGVIVVTIRSRNAIKRSRIPRQGERLAWVRVVSVIELIAGLSHGFQKNTVLPGSLHVSVQFIAGVELKEATDHSTKEGVTWDSEEEKQCGETHHHGH
jgi:hypothetical protein